MKRFPHVCRYELNRCRISSASYTKSFFFVPYHDRHFESHNFVYFYWELKSSACFEEAGSCQTGGPKVNGEVFCFGRNIREESVTFSVHGL